jgi:FkbM family methyltransferase
LKPPLKSLLKRFGYRLIPYAPNGEPALRLLPLLVKLRVAQNNAFFFVQIGANDGVMDDPLYDLVRAHGLAGLLVEPMPDFFDRLQQNYADQPQLRFENCAIGPSDGSRTIYRFASDSVEHARAAGHASFFRRHLEKQERYLPGCAAHIEELEVTTMTLASLFEKHSIQFLDLLQIDTEGFDFEIIKMLLGTDVRPAIINYERVNLILADQERCRRLLENQGYRFADEGRDTIAILEEAFTLA